MGGINKLLLLTCSFQFSEQLTPPQWRVGGKDVGGNVTSSNMAAMTSATLARFTEKG